MQTLQEWHESLDDWIVTSRSQSAARMRRIYVDYSGEPGWYSDEMKARIAAYDKHHCESDPSYMGVEE